ncbi:hypothetical protein [Sphingomonas abietis]|uniref:hypothetical protein n=1 Tax=Sphingomonas abietis TaxID=3012344 RepID=UPI00389AFF5E
MQTVKAAVVHEFGKPIVIEDAKVPMPGAGQILFRIAATGVSPKAFRQALRMVRRGGTRRSACARWHARSDAASDVAPRHFVLPDHKRACLGRHDPLQGPTWIVTVQAARRKAKRA